MWNSVQAAIQFFDASSGTTWSQFSTLSVTDVSPGESLQILGYLREIYEKSNTARSFLDLLVLTGEPIRIGKAANGEVGFGVPGTSRSTAYIGIDLVKIPQTYFMNDHGTLTVERPGLAILHELQHMFWNASAADPSGDPTAENMAYYDHNGRPINFTNVVAHEMGWDDLVQSSYATGMATYHQAGSDIDWRPITLKQGYSYSNGEIVSITRFGDAAGLNSVDNLDQSAKGNSNDLLIGFGGDDVLNGGAGRDFIYGGTGNDTIIGGAGNDVIWGGMEVDNGSADGIDTADYTAAPAGISINFAGTAAGSTLTVNDGEGGTDTLHSIEQIIGSRFHDNLHFSGSIPAGTVLSIDSGGGDSHDDLINLKKLWEGVTFHNHTTSGTFTSGVGGTINFTNFHTDIVGSDYDDTIIDDATGPKSIDGGAGNDTISVSVGAANIDGGEGDDTITGGLANDVISGGAGTNTLDGGAGSDRIISTSGRDTLNGGDGSDYIQVTATAGSGTNIDGGGGNDVIDAQGSTSDITLHFGVGSGHDTVSSGAGVAQFMQGRTYENSYPDAWRFASDTSHLPTGSSQFGISRVDLSSLAKSDVRFVWEVTPLQSVHQPVVSEPAVFLDSFVGNLVIVIISTGESLLFENVYGVRYFFGDQGSAELEQPDVEAGFRFYLPAISFADGDLSASDFADQMITGHAPISLSFGNTDAYHLALSEFVAATAAPQSDTQGTDGSDDLKGGSGNDSLSGGAGDDNFTASAGRDTYDGGDGNDTLTLFGTASDFSAIRNADGTIDLIDKTGLTGISVLTSVENLEFVKDDTTVSLVDFLTSHPPALRGTEASDTLVGTAFSESLVGLGGDDTLSGGLGNDILTGGAGNDTYVFHGGDGNDTIQEGYSDPTTVDILLLADVLPQGITISEDGTPGHAGDLLIGIIATGEVIRVVGQFSVDSGEGSWLQKGIEGIQFADGTVWDRTVLAANPTIFGTPGADDLTSSTYGTTIIPDAGDDLIHAESGGSRIIYNSGDGNDVINGSRATVVLSDLSDADVQFSSDGSDLLIQILGTGESLRILNQFSYSDAGGNDLDYAGYLTQRLSGVQFADGTSIDWAGIAAATIAPTAVTLTGTQGADRILGTFFNDAIAGGAGDDVLGGFSGNDALFGDDGNDTLFGGQGDDSLFGGSGNDLLIGGDGNDVMTGGSGDDVYIVTDPGDSVTELSGGGTDEVRTQLSEYALPDGVENLTGNSWIGQSLSGNDSDNVITGNAGDDFLFGLAGDDTFVASGGRDTYDGGAGSDTLRLSGSSANYYALRNLDGTLELVDQMGSSGNSVLTSIETLAFATDGLSISLSDFLAAQGAVPLQGTPEADVINGTAGADILLGLAGADTLSGGAGNDVLKGGSGSDTYVFAAGDGNDTIQEDLSFFAFDVLSLENILPQNVQLSEDGTPGHVGDLLVSIASTGETLRVVGQFSGWSASGLEAIRFTDGTVWNKGTIQLARTILGTEGNDDLSSTNMGATITGGLGDDRVNSVGGADRLIYRSGDGNDVFSDTGGGWDGDKLILPDLNLVDLSFVREGRDLIIEFTATGGSLRVIDQFAIPDFCSLDSAGDPLSSLDGIQFADGTSMDWSQIAAAAIAMPLAFTGTAGDDTIRGTTYDDTINGGSGNDVLGGFGGNDVLSGNDGDDVLFGGPGDDTLLGGAGNDSLNGGTGSNILDGGAGNDVYFVATGDDAVIELVDGGADEIQTYMDQYVLPDNVENLRGLMSWSGQALTGNGQANIIQGSWSNDTIDGLAGDDTLIGGPGADLLSGGAGNDVFQFADFDTGLDSGADRISDFMSGVDIIDLTRVDANSVQDGDQAFNFIGSQPFTGIAGELRYEQNAGDTWLQWDVDGDGVADSAIVLTGSISPVAADFVL